MLGVLTTRDAQRMAQQQGLDLVEVSPNADPPVCKIMDFGKFRYDEGMKRKQARKSQQRMVIKEIKFHANVDEHDLETKLRKTREFLEEGHKVKLTLAYRGRENAHKDLGIEVMQTVVKELEAVAICEQPPRLLGRLLGCMLAPKPQKAVKSGGGGAPRRPETPAPAKDPAPASASVPETASAPAPAPATSPAPAPDPATSPAPAPDPAPVPAPTVQAEAADKDVP
jgi:translation initiation factor IF-3